MFKKEVEKEINSVSYADRMLNEKIKEEKKMKTENTTSTVIKDVEHKIINNNPTKIIDTEFVEVDKNSTAKPDFGNDYTTEESVKSDEIKTPQAIDIGFLSNKQRRELKKKLGIPKFSDKPTIRPEVAWNKELSKTIDDEKERARIIRNRRRNKRNKVRKKLKN